MRSTRFRGLRLPVLIIVIAIVAAACGSDNAAPTTTSAGQPSTSGGQGTPPAGKKGGVFKLAIGEPKIIDPYGARESEGINVNKALFVGLVTYDGNADLKMKPGVADTWEPNADCTAWTFHLKKGTKFSNGEEVTADSFIRGMTRAADGKADSKVAYHMAGIDGYAALHGGGKDKPPTATTFSGLSAPDQYTLAAKLSEADCEFDKKTLQPVFSPVPKDAGAFDNKTYNEAPIGNGPFKIKPGTKWEHDKGITLVRNETYSLGPQTNLDEVDFQIFPAEGRLDAEYKAFTAGDLNYARIPPTLLPQAEQAYKPQGNFIKEEKYGINYILPNTKSPVMASADARRAVSMAIDRNAIATGVFSGFVTPATALVPPPFGNYFQDGVCDACKLDVTKAKDLAAKSGLAPGTKIRFAYNNDGGHEAWVQAVKGQLETNLGVSVDLIGVPFSELLDIEDKGDYDIARAAWGADYPTPDNFLYPLLQTDSGDNTGKYSNKAFDDLLTKERAAKDDATRKTGIQAAEKLAIGQDVALIPLWYRTQYRVFDSKKWTGVAMDFFEDPTLDKVSQK